jgi:hypothetical protein
MGVAALTFAGTRAVVDSANHQTDDIHEFFRVNLKSSGVTRRNKLLVAGGNARGVRDQPAGHK